MIIALDGPAGSGKSTIAKSLSQNLEIEYIDSGAIYRTLTLYGMRQYGNSCSGFEQKIADFFKGNPDFLGLTYEEHTQKMWLDGEDVSSAIRHPEVTRQIRHVAGHAACREIVDQKMRQLANSYSFVIDGRDIGTVVFPDTPYKFYLDASPQVRAIRRAKELNIPLKGPAFKILLRDIAERDTSDMNRDLAPLKRADDAIIIDSSDLSIEGVLEAIQLEIKKIKESRPSAP